MLLCAIAFSIHILVIDHFSPKVDGVKMSAIQFLTAAIISAVPTLLWEQPVFTAVSYTHLDVYKRQSGACDR